VSIDDLALVLLSALLHAGWNALVKRSRDPLAFNVVLSLAPALVVVPLLAFFDPRDVPWSVWVLTAATGVAHGFYFLWLTRAYELGDLSLVYPISRSAPAFVALAAGPLLGEHPTPLGGLGIAIVVGGMWLVQTGGLVRWRALTEPGSTYAYLALAATVAYSLVDKRAMAQLGGGPWTGPAPRAVVFYFLMCAAAAPVFVPLGASRLRPGAVTDVLRAEGGQVLGAVVVSFVSYGLVLQALRTAPVSYVVAARQMSVLFAVALGVVWLRETPGRARLVGSAATVVGVALSALA